VYEKDGEKYFVVEGHMHFWNADGTQMQPVADLTGGAGADVSAGLRG
jgi:hypothetical protein